MKTHSRMYFLFVILAAANCAKVDTAPGAASGGQSGGPASGSGGSGTNLPGSGGSGVPGTGGDQRGSTTGGGGMGGGDMNCGLEKFELARKVGDVVIVLDRSKSMLNNSKDQKPAAGELTKWDQLIPALTDTISKAGQDISWGLKTFPEGMDTTACSQPTVTAKIDLPVSAMNYMAVNAAIHAVQALGDGTPTGAAVGVATDYLKNLNDDNKHFLLLATDGQPSCTGRVGNLAAADSKVTQPDSVAAVTAAAAAGIHTFVVGVATKDTDTTTLNLLAAAGLEPRSDPNPLATKFYLGSTNAELVAALQAIAGVVNKDCRFALSKVPPVPDNIAVKVMGIKVPFDTTNTTGWNYVDSTTVEVYGTWCDMIKTAAANMVQIIFGCPNIEIP